ncbi:SDR family NAD(P)-dependent oxidoreductase [Roseomonas marmotae]|uniref:SDR family NAD(P)-dependent oxidoreductase n=1 Tax=Roseomonas marmotae TaxID=2768161 RepID=UPI001F3822DA|nr:SDR family NAD(P)-dependent oxidoreductase [Roseomonas marmotae]
MQLSLENRTALITGGSKGLGLAMARAFTEAGARVAIVARGEAALRQAASATGAVPVQADIATAEGCEAAFREAGAALGRIDILVNNAGTSQRAPFPSVTDTMWQQDLDLKLFAAIRLSRLAWGGMAERRWGRITSALCACLHRKRKPPAIPVACGGFFVALSWCWLFVTAM